MSSIFLFTPLSAITFAPVIFAPSDNRAIVPSDILTFIGLAEAERLRGIKTSSALMVSALFGATCSRHLSRRSIAEFSAMCARSSACLSRIRASVFPMSSPASSRAFLRRLSLRMSFSRLRCLPTALCASSRVQPVPSSGSENILPIRGSYTRSSCWQLYPPNPSFDYQSGRHCKSK